MPELSFPTGITPAKLAAPAATQEILLNNPTGIREPALGELKGAADELKAPTGIQTVSEPPFTINILLVTGILLFILLASLFIIYISRRH